MFIFGLSYLMAQKEKWHGTQNALQTNLCLCERLGLKTQASQVWGSKIFRRQHWRGPINTTDFLHQKVSCMQKMLSIFGIEGEQKKRVFFCMYTCSFLAFFQLMKIWHFLFCLSWKGEKVESNFKKGENFRPSGFFLKKLPHGYSLLCARGRGLRKVLNFSWRQAEVGVALFKQSVDFFRFSDASVKKNRG